MMDNERMSENLGENLEVNQQNVPKGTESLPNLEKASEVKEIVGESAAENASEDVKKASKKTEDKKKETKTPKVAKARVEKEMSLPSVEIQQKEIKKAVQAQIRSLQWEAFKEKVTPGFNATKFEEIVMKIRSLKQILQSLRRIAKEALAELYKKFVNTRL